MALLRKEREALAFLGRHLAYGAAGGFVFGGLVMALDLGNLRTLMLSSESPLLAIAMLFFGLFVTFGSAGMGVGVMSLGEDEN